MHLLTDKPNFPAIQADLSQKSWLIACLCAAWCDTCEAYKTPLADLSEQHQDKCFAWIDIEDQAQLVEDVDIDNFPTLLVQYNDTILFFGTMLPDTQHLQRLLSSLVEQQSKPSPKNTIEDEADDKAPAPFSNWNLRRVIASQ